MNRKRLYRKCGERAAKGLTSWAGSQYVCKAETPAFRVVIGSAICTSLTIKIMGQSFLSRLKGKSIGDGAQDFDIRHPRQAQPHRTSEAKPIIIRRKL
jgi:hypothetical protein